MSNIMIWRCVFDSSYNIMQRQSIETVYIWYEVIVSYSFQSCGPPDQMYSL